LKELIVLLRCSTATIRRRLRERRAGMSTFPLPVSPRGKKCFWDRKAIENWLEEPKDHSIDQKGGANE